MATIETKYSAGDRVWYASTTTETRQRPCPDCNGTKQWEAKSPAGNVYTFSCPRCSSGYRYNDILNLTYNMYVPTARQLTIGSIRHDSKPFPDKRPETTYMCVETGVGGGSVYDEDKLFVSEEEAIACAQGLADTQNVTVPYIVKAFNRTLEISDYQLDSALIKQAADHASRARSMLWNLDDLWSSINEAGDRDAILEAVEEYKEWSWKSDMERAEEKS